MQNCSSSISKESNNLGRKWLPPLVPYTVRRTDLHWLNIQPQLCDIPIHVPSQLLTPQSRWNRNMIKRHPIKQTFRLQVVWRKQRQRFFIGGGLLIFKILWKVEMIVCMPSLRPTSELTYYQIAKPFDNPYMCWSARYRFGCISNAASVAWLPTRL